MKKISTGKEHWSNQTFPEAGVLLWGGCLGGPFFGRYVSGLLRHEPVPVVVVQAVHLLLGGCANVFNNIYAMGGKVYGAGLSGA
jgi:D-beta-D-heptose 7-phosphate kinase/D-beta-D-heptose 1-phosphate adenosyltransferase